MKNSKKILILLVTVLLVGTIGLTGCKKKENVETGNNDGENEEVDIVETEIDKVKEDVDEDIDKDKGEDEKEEDEDKEEANSEQATDENKEKDKPEKEDKDKDKDKVDKDKVDKDKDKVDKDKGNDEDKDNVEDNKETPETISKIAKVHTAIKESLGDNYTANMEMSSEQLENILKISISELEDFIAEIPMMSTNVDTFIAINTDKDNIKDIEGALLEYREYLMNESMQYPMNMAKIKASKVVTIDNDVYFIMLGAFDDRDGVSEDEELDFAESQVSKLEKIIKDQYKK